MNLTKLITVVLISDMKTSLYFSDSKYPRMKLNNYYGKEW